jgi:hypothetical protein
MRSRAIVAAALLALPLAANAQRARTPSNSPRILMRALDAMGGEAALRAIQATRLEYYSALMGLGQEHQPGGLPILQTRAGVIVRDLVVSRMIDSGEQHNVQFRALNGFVNARYSRLVTPALGGEIIGSYWGKYGPSWARRESRALRLTPERILLTALAARCSDVPRAANVAAGWDLRCTDSSGVFLIAFNPTTGLPREIGMDYEVPYLGRRPVRVRLDEYHAVDAPGLTAAGSKTRILLPHALWIEYEGKLLSATYYGRIELLPAQPDSMFRVPARLRDRVSLDPRDEPIVTTQLSDGVFRLARGPYASVAIRQSGPRGDSIVVLDLPETPAHARAMLDTLRARFPTAPVRLIVNSHAHADHSYGLLAAFADGIPVLTHSDNVGFLRQFELADRTSPIRQRTVKGLRDSLVVGSGPTALKLWAIPTREATTFVVGYLPAARLLWAPDIAEGSGPGAEVRRVVQVLGMTVDRVVPGHTPPYAWVP